MHDKDIERDLWAQHRLPDHFAPPGDEWARCEWQTYCSVLDWKPAFRFLQGHNIDPPMVDLWDLARAEWHTLAVPVFDRTGRFCRVRPIPFEGAAGSLADGLHACPVGRRWLAGEDVEYETGRDLILAGRVSEFLRWASMRADHVAVAPAVLAARDPRQLAAAVPPRWRIGVVGSSRAVGTNIVRATRGRCEVRHG